MIKAPPGAYLCYCQPQWGGADVSSTQGHFQGKYKIGLNQRGFKNDPLLHTEPWTFAQGSLSSARSLGEGQGKSSLITAAAGQGTERVCGEEKGDHFPLNEGSEQRGWGIWRWQTGLCVFPKRDQLSQNSAYPGTRSFPSNHHSCGIKALITTAS